MERISTSSKAVNLFGAGKHGFSDGVPGTATLPTAVGAAWFNGIQEEMAGVVEASGLVLSSADNTQVMQALQLMFGKRLDNYRWVTDRTSAGPGVVMGAVSGAQRTANGVALNQHMADMAAQGRGVLLAPFGEIQYDGTLVPQNFVKFAGMGKGCTYLTYYGNTLAINAVGTNVNRKIFSFQHMTIRGVAGNSAQAVRLGYNMRSTSMFPFVEFAVFGGHGLVFADQTWVNYLQDTEIHDCGTAVSGGSAIYREPAVANIVELRLVRCVIEANGNATSVGGGITFACNAPNYTQGLWIQDCLIEGNFGALDVYVDRCDALMIRDLYLEVDPAGSTTRNGMELRSSYGTIAGGRLSSGVGNTSGSAIHLTNGSHMNLMGNAFDTDFGSCDLRLSGGSTAYQANPIGGLGSQLRVIKDATSGLVGGGMSLSAWGTFDGKTGATATRKAGENFSTVARVSAGTYDVTMARTMPNLNYGVTGFCEDGATVAKLDFTVQLVSGAPGFSNQTFRIVTLNSAGNPVDARSVTFFVVGSV